MEKSELSLKTNIYKSHIDYAKFCASASLKEEKEIEENLISAKKAKHIKMKNLYSERANAKVGEAIEYNKLAQKDFEEAINISSKYCLKIAKSEIEECIKYAKQRARKLTHKKSKVIMDRLIP